MIIHPDGRLEGTPEELSAYQRESAFKFLDEKIKESAKRLADEYRKFGDTPPYTDPFVYDQYLHKWSPGIMVGDPPPGFYRTFIY